MWRILLVEGFLASPKRLLSFELVHYIRYECYRCHLHYKSVCRSRSYWNISKHITELFSFPPLALFFRSFKNCVFFTYSPSCSVPRKLDLLSWKWKHFCIMAHQWAKAYSLSRIHDHTQDTPHLVGLLWKSDQPHTETSTWQHTALTTDIHVLCGDLTFRNPASYIKDGHTATFNTPHFLYFFNKYPYLIF
jgi:hypothetical protein